MTCRSCGFENMKNSTVCARCGAKLVWDGPARKRDFRPRRAGSGLVRRMGIRFRRLWNRLAETVPAIGLFRRIPRENARRARASVVPGLGLLMAGKTLRAAGAFAIWTLALATTVIGARRGVFIATYGLGIMALVHSYAIVAALNPAEFCRTTKEARLIALLLATAVFVVYTVVAYCIFGGMTTTILVRRYAP